MSFEFKPAGTNRAEMTVLWFAPDDKTVEDAMSLEVGLGPASVELARFDAFCEGLRRASAALTRDMLYEGVPPALDLLEQKTLSTADDFARILLDAELRKITRAQLSIQQLQSN